MPPLSRSLQNVMLAAFCVAGSVWDTASSLAQPGRKPTSVAVSRPAASPPDSIVVPAPVLPVEPVAWKALLVSGNAMIDSYNNAAADLAFRLRLAGVERQVVMRSPDADSRGRSVPPARRGEVRRAMYSLGTTPDDGCIIFITSHGNGRGIYVAAEHRFISARDLSAMIDVACGERPTVLILSGCETGAFVTPPLAGPNRIILAASARGRVSYGSAPTDRYVNFDRCLIKAIDDGARTWSDVFQRTVPCVMAREQELGVPPSEPQAWFGHLVSDLKLPGKI